MPSFITMPFSPLPPLTAHRYTGNTETDRQTHTRARARAHTHTQRRRGEETANECGVK